MKTIRLPWLPVNINSIAQAGQLNQGQSKPLFNYALMGQRQRSQLVGRAGSGPKDRVLHAQQVRPTIRRATRGLSAAKWHVLPSLIRLGFGPIRAQDRPQGQPMATSLAALGRHLDRAVLADGPLAETPEVRDRGGADGRRRKGLPYQPGRFPGHSDWCCRLQAAGNETRQADRVGL